MPNTNVLFEEMLATYSADKRELARAAYNRFVDGDTTHFFTQLFLLLDVYANYSNRIPQAMDEANQNALNGLKKIREEIALLAQTVEKRSVDMGNAAEETSFLCLKTQEKAEAAAQRLEKLTKDIASQVDTKIVAETIRKSIDAGIRKEVITPFLQRSEELAKTVLPTLEQIKQANEEAARAWPGRIWKMALTCGLVLGLVFAIVGTGAAFVQIKSRYDQKLAEQIVAAERTISQNRDAFRELAIANVALKVMPVGNRHEFPSGYALVVDGIDGIEQRKTGDAKQGVLFFSSQRKEAELDGLSREAQNVSRKTQGTPK